jgi:hypothetical protein|tara:strand:- start:167 stop:568 length:402 start_codon:yes stop_codon:yes gene_type:complete
MARKISKARAAAIKHGYRSGFEHRVADQLSENKVKFKYEDTQIDYIKPETHHKYTVDFTLPNGILVETKGRWVLEDRKKHLLIKSQHPELDIRIVFQNPKGKIRKGSKTTYADWCDKHGIIWADKEIPKDWLK